MDKGTANAKGEGILSRMALNDNKAGMEGLDRDKINAIIMEASKGSRFYENELKRDQQVNQRIEKMMQQKSSITEEQLKKAQAQVEKLVTELEKHRDLSRVIVHVDMDAFYVAVEMRDCPELKDKPMAVGSMSMLSTSNYHARKYGVRAAMPGFIAKKLCPNLVIVPTNFDKYRAVSKEIQVIFAEYDPNFQTVSLDEAYLDFTEHLEQRKSWTESARTHYYCTSINDNGEAQMDPVNTTEDVKELSPVLFEDSPSSSPVFTSCGSAATLGKPFEVFGTSAEEAVREMRFRIEQTTKLTASAGIAPNMMLAKVCSDKNKPNGQYRLPSRRDDVMNFIQNLPVRKVPGIGKVSEKMLNALGICSCSHLGQQMALLSLLFSETAWHHFIELSLGLGSTYIPRHEERKSMSTERTFKELSRAKDQFSLCRELCEDLAEDMKKEGLKGKTVTLKLKNVNFEVKTKAVTLQYAVATADEIFATAKDLLKTEIENEAPCQLRLRLMGVRVSAFVSTEDKKPLQKSIIGFFQQGIKDCSASGSSQGMPQKSERQKILWHSKQEEEQKTIDKPKLSFFQMAHAKRLQLQAENAATQEMGTMDRPSTSVNNVHNNTDVLTTRQAPNSNSAPSITQNIISPSPEPQASTSGCGITGSDSLTCPVCFSQVQTTDLNVFNNHIDQCLTGASTRQDQITDSESDLNSQTTDIKFQVLGTQRGNLEAEEIKVNIFEYSQQDFSQVNQLEGCKNRDIALDSSDSVAVDSEPPKSCDDKCPVLICPVCHKTQDTNDLTAFNHHVDLCLNQEVLHKLGGQTIISMKPASDTVNKVVGTNQLLKKAAKGKTKRRDSPSSPPSKKAKGHGPRNTIDRFFR